MRLRTAKPLNKREIIAFKLHLIYSFIEGIILGVFALNEFVFIKSMHGNNLQLGLLFQTSVVVFLLLFFINNFLKKVKNKRKLIQIVGILTRSPLLILVFFPSESSAYISSDLYHYIFLAVFLIYYLGNPIIFPSISLFLKNSYSQDNFGILYSFSTSLNKVVMLVVTFVYSWMLDIDPYVFRYTFPFLAVAGVASSVVLSYIPFKIPININGKNEKTGLWASINSMIGILKNNKSFRFFQWAFMAYGFAFMITTPVITLFFKDVLDLNYSSVAFYRNIYYVGAIIMLPYMGKLIGRIGPMRFGIITFTSLAIYFLFVLLTEYQMASIDLYGYKIFYMLIPAMLFHSIFAATMGLLWDIGSSYFGKNEEVMSYQNIHLFLTGLRALVAPIIGIWLLGLTDYTFTFSIGIILLGVAMFFLRNKSEKE